MSTVGDRIACILISNRMYLRSLNTDKRALKILRLKKNQDKEDHEEAFPTLKETTNYLSALNSTGQRRFGRSDPELRNEWNGKRNLNELDELEPSPASDLVLYSRFY